MKSEPQAAINACSAAADELAEMRRLATALEGENAGLRVSLETGQKLTAALEGVNEARSAENHALRDAIKAKDETIAAKEALIVNRGQMIDALKKKPRSPLKRFGDLLLGAAIFAILK